MCSFIWISPETSSWQCNNDNTFIHVRAFSFFALWGFSHKTKVDHLQAKKAVLVMHMQIRILPTKAQDIVEKPQEKTEAMHSLFLLLFTFLWEILSCMWYEKIIAKHSRRSIIQAFNNPNLSINQIKGHKPMLKICTNLQFDNPNHSIIRTQFWQRKCSDYQASTVHLAIFCTGSSLNH